MAEEYIRLFLICKSCNEEKVPTNKCGLFLSEIQGRKRGANGGQNILVCMMVVCGVEAVCELVAL